MTKVTRQISRALRNVPGCTISAKCVQPITIIIRRHFAARARSRDNESRQGSIDTHFAQWSLVWNFPATKQA